MTAGVDVEQFDETGRLTSGNSHDDAGETCLACGRRLTRIVVELHRGPVPRPDVHAFGTAGAATA
jgi:hypothetical protein